jgi:hypothetical protein
MFVAIRIQSHHSSLDKTNPRVREKKETHSISLSKLH